MKRLTLRQKAINLINNLPLSKVKMAVEYLEYLAINSESVGLHKKIKNALDDVRIMRDGKGKDYKNQSIYFSDKLE